MASKDLKRVDQGELALTRKAEPNEVPIELIRRQKTAAAAFQLAIQSSGLDDQEVYRSLELDAGYFSRIKKGEATLQADLVRPFCEVVGNRIYVEWQSYQAGCTLVRIKSEVERELEMERAEKVRLKDRLQYVESLMVGRIAA